MNAVKLIILSLIFVQTGLAQDSSNELNDISSYSTAKGLSVNLNAGYLGFNRYERFHSFHFVTKYRFNKNWALGIGSGVDFFTFNRTRVPVFIEGEYHFTSNAFDPFVGLLGGYELTLRERFGPKNNNLTYGGKIGFNYFFSKHFGLSTSFGYRFANVDDMHSCMFVSGRIRGIEGRVGLIIK